MKINRPVQITVQAFWPFFISLKLTIRTTGEWFELEAWLQRVLAETLGNILVTIGQESLELPSVDEKVIKTYILRDFDAVKSVLIREFDAIALPLYCDAQEVAA